MFVGRKLKPEVGEIRGKATAEVQKVVE